MYTKDEKEKYNKISNVTIFGKKYRVIHQKKNVINSPIRVYMGLCYSMMENCFTRILMLRKNKWFCTVCIYTLFTIIFSLIMNFVIANAYLRRKINDCSDTTNENCRFMVENCKNELIKYISNKNVSIRTYDTILSFENLKSCIKIADPNWISVDLSELSKLFISITFSVLATTIAYICLINFMKVLVDFILLLICKYKKRIVYEFPEVSGSGIV